MSDATNTVNVDGQDYMRDAKGSLVPVDAVKAQDKLEDETVRKIIGYARVLSDQIARFRGHTFTDLGEFDALIEQEYGATKGGRKGNRPRGGGQDLRALPDPRRRQPGKGPTPSHHPARTGEPAGQGEVPFPGRDRCRQKRARGGPDCRRLRAYRLALAGEKGRRPPGPIVRSLTNRDFVVRWIAYFDRAG